MELNMDSTKTGQRTPPPWEAYQFSGEDGWDVRPLDLYDNEYAVGLLSEADARLIAAAPEMLEMLKYCLGIVEDARGAYQQVRDIIAKAEGRASAVTQG